MSYVGERPIVRMIETMRTILFPGQQPPVVYECRSCGTTVDSERSTCPFCEADDIVQIYTR